MGNEETECVSGRRSVSIDLVLDNSGCIPGYEPAPGTFSFKPEAIRLFTGTNLPDAIIRYPASGSTSLCAPGVKMFFAKQSRDEIGCVMEIEVDDEKAPGYVRDLFDKFLVVNEQGRYFYFRDGSSLTPGRNTLLRRCKRDSIVSVFGVPIGKAINSTSLFQKEGAACRDTTLCVWATVSSQLDVKVKLSLLLGVYEGTLIYNQLFSGK